jgi:hypothetical protein
MAVRFVRATGLPENPLDAATDFYSRILPAIREDLEQVGEIVVGFEPAGHDHYAWRLAAIRDLAREVAPCRVNGVVVPATDPVGCAETLNYLNGAPGITGQLLAVGSTGN